jgi:hypothetical protein
MTMQGGMNAEYEDEQDLTIPPTGEYEDEPNDQVKAKVTAWCKKVEKAKNHWEDDFDRMADDMDFAAGLQWPEQETIDDSENGYRYVVNLVQRHLRQREAGLYAKNPRAVAHQRKTRLYRVWDGDANTLLEAQMTLQQVQMQMQQNPAAGQMLMAIPQVQQAQAILQDVSQGRERKRIMDNLGETLEIVYDYEISQQQPKFKRSMKRLVRRTLTTGVGYVKISYTRDMQVKPEDLDKVTDISQQVSRIRALLEDVRDPNHREGLETRLNELQDSMTILQQPQIVREGLDYDFPRSTAVIPDWCCTELEDFLGAQWVAEEYKLTPEQIKAVYKVDVKDKYTPYDMEGERIEKASWREMDDERKKDGTLALVWEIYDKSSGTTFTVCKGYHGYLREPGPPDVQLERFWPYFTLIFNGLEHDEQVYPPSDVSLMRSMQVEYNLSRQRLREHRDAARPGHVAPKGRLEQSDKDKLATRQAHDVLEVSGLGENDDIRRLLQAIPVNPIDPNLYETSTLEGDIYKALGSQEAVMGGTGGATATETSIAESSRLTSIGSNVDDLDDLLTYMAQTASKVLMSEMSTERVKEIAGPGAVWAELSAEEVSKELWLEVRAGSSGRPNKSAEIQNLERVLPFLLQMPNVKAERLVEEILTRLDDRMNVEDFLERGAPSIMSQNRMGQVGTGDEASDPNQQGPQGQDQTAVGQGDSNMGPRPPAENRNMDPNRAN